MELASAHHAYGVALAERGDWEAAAANVETAVRLASEERRFRRDLSRILVAGAQDIRRELRRGRSGGDSIEKAKHWVEQAIRADSEWAPAHLLLGDIEYDHQRLREARSAWARAASLDPGLAGLAERLGRLKQEFAAEVNMKEVGGQDFILRYEEGLSPSLDAFDLRGVLDEARRRVGDAFGHWPQRRIVVLLYSPESYRRVRREAPEWSGGVYDGKIRIPVPKSRADVEDVRRIVTHEYTHAVVDDLSSGRCPRWLNEGLAELQAARYASKDRLSGASRPGRNGALTPWKKLDAALQGPTASLVRKSYDEAHSIVAYLAQRHGFWRLREVLSALSAGADLGTAFYQNFQLTLDELEVNWRRSLKNSG